MASYYYLISSLPSLTPDSPAIEYDEFLTLCRTAVSENVYKELESLSLSDVNSFEGCRLVREFGKFYSSLMKELAYRRNNELEREYGVDSEIVQLVKNAIEASDPLKAEEILLKAQFDFTDSLCSMHYFDDYVLFGYALKIRLLERKLVFDKEKGKKEFSRLFEHIQNEINNI